MRRQKRTSLYLTILCLLLTGLASVPLAQDWGRLATISTTMGVSASRLCVGEGSRGDIGCPTYAPSLTTAGDISVTGNLQAQKFIGDGSGLTGVAAATGDRIVSGTFSSTSMVAISNTGIISVTQNGTNTAYFHPQLGLVAVGISTTGPVSATGVYSTGGVFPTVTNAYDLGTNSKYWANIFGKTFVSMGGSASTASYSWSSDYNTGLFHPSTGSIGFTTSGTEAMRIVSNSYVGIGTTNPTAKLEVNGTISATNFVGDGSGLTNINAGAISGLSTDRIISGSVSAIAQQTSGTVRVSGTLALANTGSEPCDADHAYSIRIDPVTKRMQMCRP